MKKALRWVEEDGKYQPCDLPDTCSPYEADMDTEVTCCACGKTIKYGDAYTSRTYHTNEGFGFAECEDCYFSKK